MRWRGSDAVTGQRQLADRVVEPVGEIGQRQRAAARRGELQPERDPSRLRQIVATAATSSALNGPVATFIGRRARNRAPDVGGLGSPRARRRPEERRSGSTGHTRSPATSSGSRLVATTRTPGLSSRAARRPTRRLPAAGARSCRSTITIGRSASADPDALHHVLVGLDVDTPSAAASAAGTSPTSPSGARSTKYGPNSYRPAVRAASSTARRVLPIPPVPVSVTSRLSAHSAIERGELALAADDRAQRGRQVRPTQARRGRAALQQLEVVGQDRPLQVAQRRTGLDSELGGEQQPSAAVGGEGVGGSSRLVEGEHQLAPRPLAVRVALGRTLPARRCIAHRRRMASSASNRLLDHRRLQLVQSLHLPRRQGGLGHVLVRLAAERLSSPHASTPTASPASPSAIASRASASSWLTRRASTSTAVGIEPVAAAAFDDRRRPERPPQPGDVPLQRLAGRRRRAARPQRLLQHVDRHPFAGPRSEGGEQRPFAREPGGPPRSHRPAPPVRGPVAPRSRTVSIALAADSEFREQTLRKSHRSTTVRQPTGNRAG